MQSAVPKAASHPDSAAPTSSFPVIWRPLAKLQQGEERADEHHSTNQSRRPTLEVRLVENENQASPRELDQGENTEQTIRVSSRHSQPSGSHTLVLVEDFGRSGNNRCP
jgi:hypothetical protein